VPVQRTILLLGLLLGLLLALGGGPRPAHAETSGVLRATDGLLQANPAVAASDDPLALEVNPAGLAGLEGFGLSLQAVLPRLASQGGEGYGLFLGAPLLGGALVPGVAVQYLDETALADSWAVKTTLAAAVGGPRLAFGVGWSGFAADQAAVDEVGVWELGLLARPTRWFSRGGRVQNLGEDLLGTQRLPTLWRVGLGLRPGTDRLTLTGEVALARETPLATGDGRLATAAGFNEARLGISFVPLHGLRVEAGVGLDRDGLDRAGLVLALQQTNVGLRGETTHTASRELDLQSVGLRLDLGGGTHRPLLPWPGDRVVELQMPEKLSESRTRTLLGPATPTPLDLVEGLARVEQDPRVGTLLVRLGPNRWSLAQTAEVRQALSRIQQAGKKVRIHLEDGGTSEYYLASVADELTMPPGSSLLLLGLSATFTYLRDTLDRIHVKPEFVRIGRHKNAPEMYTANGMSTEQREVEEALLDGIYQRLVEDTARSRRKTPAQLRQAIDEGPYIAERAQERGLVDRIEHFATIKEQLTQQGASFLPGYFGRRLDRQGWSRPPRIAVIAVDGLIADGRSSELPLPGSRVAGAETLLAALEEAAGDSSVRAIVLRIDSPGGSATAAERIHRGVATAAQKKPLIVSLGATAASGGYYIAVPGKVVFAQPSTITGSIGIFAGKFDLSGLFSWLGVGRSTVRRGERADLLGVDRPFSDAERAAVRDQLRDAYKLFVRRVAEGRRLTPEQVEERAEGRVWTGEQALARQLVDRLGGLADALAEARRQGGLDPDEEVELWQPRSSSGVQLSVAADVLAETPPRDDLATLLGLDWRAPHPLLASTSGLLAELGWLPALLMRFVPGEPLALLEDVVEVR